MRSTTRGGICRLRLLFLLGAVVLLILACRRGAGEEEWGTIRIPSGQPIRIGHSTSLSGGTAALGLPIDKAVRLAAEEKREIKGHRIEVDSQDDGCGSTGSLSVANRFTSDPLIVGVIGPMCSSGCVPASATYQDKKLVMITASCTGAAVTQQGHEVVFRVAWNDNVQGDGQAQFAKDDLKVKRVFAIHDQSIYAKGLKDAFKRSFEGGDRRVVAEEAITVGDKDFSALISKIRAANPDMIYFAGFVPEGTLLIQQLKQAGVNVPFMGADGIKDVEAFIRASGGAAEGAYVTDGNPIKGKIYDEFVQKYKARWNEDPGVFSPQGYDAMQVLFRALERVAKDEGGTLVIDRKALRDAIAATDYEGASGRIQFEKNGERKVAGGTLVTQVRGGAFATVKEIPPPK